MDPLIKAATDREPNGSEPLNFTARKAFLLFGAEPTKESPKPKGSIRALKMADIPEFGSRHGFLQKPQQPLAISVFVTKGGVLKTSLTLNLARMAALQGLKVCVVGLDMQGDMTQTLGAQGPDEEASLEEALRTLNSMKGLSDLFVGQSTLRDILQPTDIPTLWYIPETPELVALDQSLLSRNRREYWLLENVVAPLKLQFDLVLMDCSPNWNRLINNALVASDALISPVESKINNFRNLRTFRALISEFKRDMKLEFKHVYVPTRVVSSRRLSREIFDWYRANLEGCTEFSIRESVHGEEASALRISVPEHSPQSAAASEIRLLALELGRRLGFAKLDSAKDDRSLLLLDRARLFGSPESALSGQVEV